MRRIALCLLIALASATVAARESKLADANGGSCPTRANADAASRAPDRDPVAPPEKKARQGLPAAIGGGNDASRLPSPRWNRFLPGMFR